jgi:hypothetical protein
MTKTNKEKILEVAEFMSKMPALEQSGNYHNKEKTCFCIRGAFYELGYHDEVIKIIYDEIRRLKNNSVVWYNDDPNTTLEDVVTTLRNIAEKVTD